AHDGKFTSQDLAPGSMAPVPLMRLPIPKYSIKIMAATPLAPGNKIPKTISVTVDLTLPALYISAPLINGYKTKPITTAIMAAVEKLRSSPSYSDCRSSTYTIG